MPYPNEHKAIIKATKGDMKRQRVGDGVSLVLARYGEEVATHAYTFNPTKFTPIEVKEYMDKIGVKVKEYKMAKLSMKASKPEVDGRIWSAGIHHVFVNDQPAKVYVPEETVMDTFNSIRSLIDREGRMPIGIDHLSNDVLADNEILSKMNLLDVGGVSKVGTDGSSIYILDSELNNDSIKQLNMQGELPSYSIVGAMDAKECPSGKADYVVQSIDVERVDFVEEGGCQVCKVGAQPNNLILTSKKADLHKEDNDMIEANEAVENIEEVKTEEVEEVEAVEEKAVEEQPEEEEVPEEEVVAIEEEPDLVSELRKELAELKDEIKNLDGKKPKVSAKDAEAAVKQLIKAGRATPRMKDALVTLYETDLEAFNEMKASLPKMVTMETKAKLAKVKKEEREAAEQEAADLSQKEMAKRYFGVEL